MLNKSGFFSGAGYRSRIFSGSNPPSASFFRLLCSVHLPQKVREIFGPKTQKSGLGLAMIAIPKPVFSGFTVFWAISALKARKLPDLSGRQIRQSICVCFTLKMQKKQTRSQCASSLKGRTREQSTVFAGRRKRNGASLF